MTGKPTYEELEERVGDIEKQVVELIKPRTIYMRMGSLLLLVR